MVRKTLQEVDGKIARLIWKHAYDSRLTTLPSSDHSHLTIQGVYICFLQSKKTSENKEVKNVKFGAKVNNIMVDGISFIEKLSLNPFSEGKR